LPISELEVLLAKTAGQADHYSGDSGYSGDTAVDNASSPKPRSWRGYSEDTQIRAGDNGGSLCPS
jgi:hypothetical protein